MNKLLTIDNNTEKVFKDSKDDVKKSNFLISKGCIIKLDEENKKINVWIYGVIIDLNNYAKLISTLNKVTKEYIIFLHINSPGGDIKVTCHILTAMSKCKGTIITHNCGSAMSCASLLLSFGDKIAVDTLSITMFHNAICAEKDSLHYLKVKIDHTINFVKYLFEKMINKGLITESEANRVLNNGEEYFLKSDIIKQRLIENNMLYEGEF